MCDNQRCTSQVQHLQNVSLAVELNRRVQARLSNAVRSCGVRGSAEYYAGVADALGLVEAWLNELSPDYSQCDNPPAEGE